MVDTEDNESHESSSTLGQARDSFLSPEFDAIKTVTAQTSRKRKHTDVEPENHIGEAFTVESHLSLPSAKAQKLVPRLLLPRSCLPLAYLDPFRGTDDLPSSTLFSAHIETLEESVHEDRWTNQPTVLIVQSAIDEGLFAVERVQGGIYAMCRLGDWVTVNTLERMQTIPIDIAPQPKRNRQEQPGLPGDNWWGTAAIGSRREHKYDRGKKIDVEKTRGMRLCLQGPPHTPTAPSQIFQETSQPVSQDQTQNVLTGMVEEAAQNPEEVLKMVRDQYQEALYASKSSLAYFAKGPLSRARAALNVNDGSAHDHSHITSFLRSCILSLATMDIKYRETLPDLVKGFPFDSLSDDECTAVVGTISKKARRSKKPNVGKNGLYPGEEVKIARWWLSRDLSSIACDSADAREEATRSAVLEQRARETQMQVILSLETLALESLAISQPVEKLLPTDPIEGDDGSQNKKKKKSKKPQDLTMLLDLLVDRLCIWQSMSMDETKTSNGEDRPKSQHGAKPIAKVADNDHLRQFCVDVVLPFYGARLPDLTTLLCQKLGGPKQPSPRRPPLLKSASSHASLKPGALVQRQQIRKPRRTLERVLTDERSASQKPPPSLSRSATDPVLPQVKREVSDTSLSSIPLNRVAMHKRYSQREVDLHATSKATEAKSKKKARVEQELRGAIAALKKPNPRMAVKELVEDAERRAATSHSRKPKNPVRNPFAQGAQVVATPSNNRHKDVYGGLPRLPRQSIASLPEVEEVPPSSISCVPSSSRKAQHSPFLAPDSTRKIGTGALPITETPTRGPSKLWGRPPVCTATMESAADRSQPPPLSAASKVPKASNDLFTSTRWSLQGHKTPTKFRCSYQVERSGDTSIHATPVKAPSAENKPSENLTKAVLSPLLQEKGESIYTALGWDDVDELL